MVNVPDPVAAGLVASLARPGGNVTGLSRQSRDIVGKNLQILREILPKARRIGALVSPTSPLKSQVVVADAKEAARSLGIDLIVVEAETTSDTERAFLGMKSEQVTAVVVLGGAGFYLNSGGDRFSSAQQSAAGDVSKSRVCGSRRSHIVCAQHGRELPTSRGFRRQDSERCETRGASDRTADSVRTRDQYQDREGPRPHHPALAAAAGGSGDQ
jgi:ABC transporter substrate binding protein